MAKGSTMTTGDPIDLVEILEAIRPHLAGVTQIEMAVAAGTAQPNITRGAQRCETSDAGDPGGYGHRGGRAAKCAIRSPTSTLAADRIDCGECAANAPRRLRG